MDYFCCIFIYARCSIRDEEIFSARHYIGRLLIQMWECTTGSNITRRIFSIEYMQAAGRLHGHEHILLAVFDAMLRGRETLRMGNTV